MTEIIRRLEQIGVIPVIAIEHIDQALDMADAPIEGGLPVAEITFRTEAAAGVIARLHERRPELLIGAGTVLNADHLAIAHPAGAAFALAPGVDASMIAKADQLGIPFYPGVMTPSDIQIGLKAGASICLQVFSSCTGGWSDADAGDPCSLRASWNSHNPDWRDHT